jgi:flagellar hook-length control protein FliK
VKRVQSVGLGTIKTSSNLNLDTVQQDSKRVKTGFGLMLTNILDSKQMIQPTEVMEQVSSLNMEELEGLITFLQNSDIFDVEEGSDLLSKLSSTSNSDYMNIILEQLNITEKELTSIITSLSESLGVETHIVYSVTNEDDEKKDVMEEIIALLTTIQSLPSEKLQKAIDKDLVTLVKFTKLVELTTNLQETKSNNESLTKLIDSILQRFEAVVRNNEPVKKMEYLHKNFSLLARELNQKTIIQTISSGTNSNEASQDNSLLTVSNKIVQSNKVEIPLMVKQVNDSDIGTKSIPVITPASTVKIGEMIQSFPTEESVSNQIEKTDSNVLHVQQTSKVEQLTLMLETSRKSVSTEDLIKQFQSIMDKSQFLKNGATQKLLIRLTPEHLGSLRIELLQKDQMMVAKLITTTSAAKETLESHLNGLKQALVNQNIQVERIEISQQFNFQERFPQRESQQQGHAQKENNHQSEQNEQEKETTFNDSLSEAIVNIEA